MDTVLSGNHYWVEAPNALLCTDTYKFSHMLQYAPGTTEVYSYLEARKEGRNVFFGLQYYLKKYLSNPITRANVQEFLKYNRKMLGSVSPQVEDKLNALADLGYWPLRIKAAPEGMVIDNKNVVMTIVNTHPDFHWCVGFLESLLLKLWAPCTVGTCSLKYRKLVEKFADETCDNRDHIPFSVHDFGYRGVSSEESAGISGAAHLLPFLGSDTVPAVVLLDKFYPIANDDTPIGLSVPASEHSVMCSFTKEGEFDAFDNMLDTYPEGIVSIVSDTYDLWNVLTNYCTSRRERILNRPGKVVFRPDSGNPVKIVCGNHSATLGPEQGSSEWKGALELLAEVFGYTLNSKGYKVLNPKVGLIYGDGMHYDRFVAMLETMKERGWASSNLVIGVGGLLLQQHSRDEFGYAMKATRTIRYGVAQEIYKDPITDPGKKSKKGLMRLWNYGEPAGWVTEDQCQNDDGGILAPVFENGKILKEYSLEDVRANLEMTCG